jgi:glycosyltransferase involved in cell wall biosynthesis
MPKVSLVLPNSLGKFSPKISQEFKGLPLEVVVSEKNKNLSLGEEVFYGLSKTSGQFKIVIFPWSRFSPIEIYKAYKLLRDTPQLDLVQLGPAGFIFRAESAALLAPKLLSFNYAVGDNILLLVEYLNLRVRGVVPFAADSLKPKFAKRSLRFLTSQPLRYYWELAELRFYDAAYNLSEFFKRLEWLVVKRPKKRKHLLIFSWRDIKHPEAGGAEVYLHKVAEKLRHNYEVTIFTSRPKDLYLYDTINGVNIIRRGGKYTVYLYAVLYYLAFLRRSANLVIDIENGLPFFTPLFCRLPKILLVHHIHKNQWLREMGPLVGALGYCLESYVMPLVYRFTKVIAVSPSTEKDLVALGFSPRQISLAYNGLSRPPAARWRRSPRPTLLYLGRLKKYKQVEVGLETVARLKKDYPTLTFLVAGVGDDLARLKTLAKRLGVASQVKFLGFVSEREKWRLLQEAWVFLMPSSREGWGVTITEAALVGTPSVGFDVPGVRDAIHNGATGLLATSRLRYYQAVSRLLRDPALRERLSLTGQAFAKSFNWQKTAEVIESAVVNEQYANLLKNKYPSGKVALRI